VIGRKTVGDDSDAAVTSGNTTPVTSGDTVRREGVIWR
jgi:hypothetical protein